MYWEENAEDETAGKEETVKALDDVYGCGERGRGTGGSDGGGCQIWDRMEIGKAVVATEP